MFRLDDLPDIGHEYGSYVIFNWIRARPGSSLHLALSAVSHAVFGRARQVDEAIEKADSAHAQSIVKTHREMKVLSNESIDQLLVTTMLMSTYEVRFELVERGNFQLSNHCVECHVRKQATLHSELTLF